MNIPESIKLNLRLDLKVRYEKHSGRYKVSSEELKITTYSKVSYAEAEKRLAEMIELKLWTDGYNLKINFKT